MEVAVDIEIGMGGMYWNVVMSTFDEAIQRIHG